MNRVGVPGTWPEARPLSTSRWIRSSTVLLALPRGGLCCGRRGEGVRVDAGQREMPEREPHVPPKLLFDLLDRIEGPPRVRALVIAVLDDQAAGGRTANMIDLLIQRRQGELAV